MDEFQLIRHYFSGLTAGSEGVVLGIGDDAALLTVPSGQELAVTSDTLVAGRHFPHQTRPFDIGWKALAVNLSDLAAMGAVPRWFTLALTLPAQDADWLAGFSEGLKALADLHGVALVGGDTTRGSLSITITAMGLVPTGRAMRRDGAVQGDLICVTGTLGDAALALRQLSEASADPSLRRRLDRPTPRVEAGQILAEWGMAAIDLSDGLAGDLNHILIASQVGAELRAEKLPQSPAFKRAAPADALALQLHGGDDYELCVCLRGEDFQAAQPRLAALGVPLTCIGSISAAPGLRLRQGAEVHAIEPRGYQHFSDTRAP
ncbi:MAG: thiamine-phosphate kinase [Stagnimonas sp.]|nr:thiamine-phosphate kinase [Stagnimonas sp.]